MPLPTDSQDDTGTSAALPSLDEYVTQKMRERVYTVDVIRQLELDLAAARAERDEAKEWRANAEKRAADLFAYSLELQAERDEAQRNLAETHAAWKLENELRHTAEAERDEARKALEAIAATQRIELEPARQIARAALKAGG